MAFGGIITSAIGILLLIITAYVLVSGALTTTQIAMNAQSDMTAGYTQMLGTSFNITSASVGNSTSGFHDIIQINLKNTGNEIIDLNHLDIFVNEKIGDIPIKYIRVSGFPDNEQTWSVDPDPSAKKIQWQPTEELTIHAKYIKNTYPIIVQLTTGNGVSIIRSVTV